MTEQMPGECRPDSGYCGQLRQRGEIWCNGRTQDVSGELKLQAEHQETPQVQTYLSEWGHTFPPECNTNEPCEGTHCTGEYDRRAGGLDDLHEEIDNVSQVVPRLASMVIVPPCRD